MAKLYKTGHLKLCKPYKTIQSGSSGLEASNQPQPPIPESRPSLTGSHRTQYQRGRGTDRERKERQKTQSRPRPSPKDGKRDGERRSKTERKHRRTRDRCRHYCTICDTCGERAGERKPERQRELERVRREGAKTICTISAAFLCQPPNPGQQNRQPVPP